jgi:hypothetical protein
MFDSNAFQKQILNVQYSEKYKKAFGGTTGFAFSYLPTSKLEDGQYQARILPPHPERCPEGWLKVATHSVLVNMGDAKGARVECIKEEDQPCAVCELLEATSDDIHTLPAHLTDILNKMVAIRKLVLPATIFAEPMKPGDIASTWRKSNKEHGAMLEIRAAGTQADLFNLMIADPTFTHHERGRYFLLTKRHNTTKAILPPDSQAGPIKTPDLMKQYPNMISAYFKNVQRLNYQDQQQFLEQAFWYNDPRIQALTQSNFYDNPSSSSSDDVFDLAFD